VNRREFITLAGSAVGWPLAARAQQSGRVKRIGALMNFSASDPQSRARVAAFENGLENLGWIIGRNVLIDYRWYMGDDALARAASAELLGLSPDLILANSVNAVRAAQHATEAIPIVFTAVSEPVAQGFVASLAHPGGNITGFTNLEPSVAAKWIELLKEIAPNVTRVAVMFNPQSSAAGPLFVRSAEAASSKFSVETIEAPVLQPSDIDAVMARLGRAPGGGLIFPPDTFTSSQRKLIVDLTAREKLPAIYAFRDFSAEGGLVSYGPDVPDQFRRAASYVDRVFRGEKPADLPVQQPTKFEFVINLKTAKALGLTIPPSVLALADEVIE
jgi:putative tryptophan/tyrosine transport system substrate-binding protein